MDEQPSPLVKETRPPSRLESGKLSRIDYEFMLSRIPNELDVHPNPGGRMQSEFAFARTRRNPTEDVPRFLEDDGPGAGLVVLAPDNLNRPVMRSRRDSFPPQHRKHLAVRTASVARRSIAVGEISRRLTDFVDQAAAIAPHHRFPNTLSRRRSLDRTRKHGWNGRLRAIFPPPFVQGSNNFALRIK